MYYVDIYILASGNPFSRAALSGQMIKKIETEGAGEKDE
jgi:hypothetical protein